jgi:hypothetical protein
MWLAQPYSFEQQEIPMTTATLVWNAVTVDVNGAPLVGPVTYDLYEGSPLAKVQSGLTSPTATVTPLAPGTYSFAVTAVNNGEESAQSAPSSVTVPFPVPAAPTGLVITLS